MMFQNAHHASTMNFLAPKPVPMKQSGSSQNPLSSTEVLEAYWGKWVAEIRLPKPDPARLVPLTLPKKQLTTRQRTCFELRTFARAWHRGRALTLRRKGQKEVVVVGGGCEDGGRGGKVAEGGSEVTGRVPGPVDHRPVTDLTFPEFTGERVNMGHV
ncbi:hypothetical protein HAX54_036255 [Datura stramonium]|uniref:Uncharacterized protein n=1 Tax=Datura stramonium TaxID=4076 RepID=A0ABS8VJX8_DATST|nr:hypothetical protein [Datura stramonium]